jgi:transcription elongation factor/antiterminator RfaH
MPALTKRECHLTEEQGVPADSDGTARWYAVQCQPHRENAAAVHLENQHIKVFFPRRETTRRHARKIERVRRPFFPGYLFIQLDITRERWRCVNGTFGVARIVMLNDQPAPAPRGVVEALMDACDEKGNLSWKMELRPGQKVRVIDGPLMDLVGQLDQLTDSDRVRVLLDIMGRVTRVVLPRSYLVPADL